MRRATRSSPTISDPRIAEAIRSLGHCTTLPIVAPPTGRMIIPHHYLSGSHGPVNPAEAVATRPYNDFERRVTAGMNQWLVTSSPQEAQCAQVQIDLWAQAATLLDYDPQESSQAWFQVEWTLSSVAISESVLVNEPSLDPALLRRDIAWMNKVAHRTVDFDKAARQTNNHHDWRGLAAVATGVVSSDDDLFRWGVAVYKQAVNEIDARGAFPQEMARHERAIHYQSFALQPLAPLAAFAERQHVPALRVPLPDQSHARGRGPLLRGGTRRPRLSSRPTHRTSSFYSPRAATSLPSRSSPASSAPCPAAIAAGLEQPTFATRIGGSTTVIAGSPAAATTLA